MSLTPGTSAALPSRRTVRVSIKSGLLPPGMVTAPWAKVKQGGRPSARRTPDLFWAHLPGSPACSKPGPAWHIFCYNVD